MKKTLLTSSIIAACTLYTHNTFANDTFEVDEKIVVTANRSQQEQFLSLSATQVIGEKEIEILQPQNVTDLLDKVAGISVVNNGGAGQNSTVFMRGTNSDHTLILVDGVRMGSATLGTTSFSAMSIAQIERIEIVKGPRAALWGADAIGGVIQIFTKKLSSGEGVVSVGLGSNNLRKADASFGLGNDVHNLTFTVAAEDSDGFSATKTDEYAYEQDDDGYDRLSFGVVGKSEISDEFSLHLTSRWDQGGSEYDPKYGGNNESASDNYYVRAAGQYKKNALYTEVSVAKSRDQSTSFGNGVIESDGKAIKTEREQLSVLSQYSFNEQTSITGGFDWYSEQVDANYDLISWEEGVQKWDNQERDVNAVFIQLRHQVNKFLFEGALRQDDIEGLDKETTFNLSAGYQLNEDFLVSVSHATAFKAPSFNDLYWPGSGNPELQPENVISSELLVRKKFTNGILEVSYFDSEIENLIVWTPNDAGVWYPRNFQAEISGVELSLAATTGDFSHQLALSYIDAEDAEKNVQLARRPEFTGNYTVSYQWDDYAFNGAFSYRDESPDTTNENSVILDSYWLVDVSVNYQATDQVVITGKVNNIFDEEYETAQNYVADGINYTLTASYSF